MDRYLLISADCHAGPLPDTLRGYVSSAYLERYDAWVGDVDGLMARRAEHTGAAIYGDEAVGDFETQAAIQQGGMDGAWDSKRRLE